MNRKQMKQKMREKISKIVPTQKMIKEITEKMIGDIFPIEADVHIKLYKAKNGSFVFQIKPLDKKE